MGTSYDHVCGDCGYKAHVCGERSVGFVAVLETMTCNDCKDLVDVLVDIRMCRGTGVDPEIEEERGRCPKCKSDAVSPCVVPMPCPKCGGLVARDENGGVTCWD